MGGHTHKPTVNIPNPDIYKVEDVPELLAVQEKLAKQGLKNPWLRNDVWIYSQYGSESKLKVLWGLLGRGWKYGVAAFLVTLAAEYYFDVDYIHKHGHDNHKNHESENSAAH